MPETRALLLVMQVTCLVFAAMAILGLWSRVLVWRRGGAQAVAVWQGLTALPRRYLKDVHDIVAREPAAARMHKFVAGGFIAAGLLFLVDLALARPTLLQLPGLAASLAMGTGAGLTVSRRFFGPEARTPRRSRGEWNRLVVMLAMLAGGLVLWFLAPRQGSDASPALLAACVLIGLGGLEIGLGLLTDSPMRHALAGAANLAFHPRPERFDTHKPDVGLTPVDLNGETFGVGTARDLAWNRILNIDACVQCGRCETACPAYDAGQPLNPKALIHDLARATGLSERMGPYSGSPHPGMALTDADPPPRGLLGGFIAPETLWSCTTCRACVAACPMMIEHVDFIVDIRRHAALESGDIPGKATNILSNLRDADTQSGKPASARFQWAGDLRLPILAPGGSCDVLWIVGESGFVPRNQRSLRAFAGLMVKAGVDFAVLGPEETDCGDIARRLGEDALFQSLAGRLSAALATRRFRRIVTTDPHVMNSLRNDYPLLGASYAVLHHTELLAELIEQRKITAAARLDQPVTYHDPCYLGRYNGEFAAPRAVLNALANPVVEMERSGKQARCCGGGGGAPLTDIPGKTRIPDQRMNDILGTGAKRVVTACPNCTIMLEGVGGERAEVVDIAELLAAAAERPLELTP